MRKKTGNHNLNNSRFRERSELGKFNEQNWQKIEITKIKLNPEQAVLSCCDSVNRQLIFTPTFRQCFSGGACAAATLSVASSS
ncbi:MAG: hypothetical protein WC214_07735 [Candidatus Omnitrophota bacterium]